MPVCRETSALASARRVVSMPLRSPSDFSRVRRIITTSSSEALPARSPMPLMVHSTRRDLLRAAARLVLDGQPVLPRRAILHLRAGDHVTAPLLETLSAAIPFVDVFAR